MGVTAHPDDHAPWPADVHADGNGVARVATVPGGRPRNAAIDRLVLHVTLSHLRRHGVRGLSVAAVAADAGTTRAAVYRRWTTKVDLVVAALGTVPHEDPPLPTGDPYVDLVAELTAFRWWVDHAGVAALTGAVLSEGVDPRVAEAFRHHVVEPRRRRFRARLQAGVAVGELRAHADFALAEDLLAGSWLAAAGSGETLGEDWPRRNAEMVWTACGGVPTA